MEKEAQSGEGGKDSWEMRDINGELVGIARSMIRDVVFSFPKVKLSSRIYHLLKFAEFLKENRLYTD